MKVILLDADSICWEPPWQLQAAPVLRMCHTETRANPSKTTSLNSRRYGTWPSVDKWTPAWLLEEFRAKNTWLSSEEEQSPRAKLCIMLADLSIFENSFCTWILIGDSLFVSVSSVSAQENCPPNDLDQWFLICLFN